MWNLVQSIRYEILFVNDDYDSHDYSGGGNGYDDDAKLWSYFWHI